MAKRPKWLLQVCWTARSGLKLLTDLGGRKRDFAQLAYLGVAVVLSGCAAGPSGDPTQLDQPLLGSQGGGGETQFYMRTQGNEVKLEDVVAMAKVLRRYKTLDAAEKKLVELAVQRNIQGMIALEAKKIAPQYEGERRRIAAMPDKESARVASAALQDRILREASARVADRLAHLAAVPVKSSENRSVVAFAKITANNRIKVADASYEVDAPPGALGTGTKVPLPQEMAKQLAASPDAKATVIAGSGGAVP